MNRSHHISHVTFYNSSYIVLFSDGLYATHGLSTVLYNQIKYAKSNIEFCTLGPNQQWFYRLEDGQISYRIHDNYINELLTNSTLQPYKIWFNGNNGYVLQFDDFNIFWKNISNDLQDILKNRSKSSSKIQNLTFGPNNTWWISYFDNSSSSSSYLPIHIKQQLIKIKVLILDPVTYQNYFIFQKTGLLTWHGSYHFNRIINEKKDNDIFFLNPQHIRYTQTTINHEFSTGQNIHQLLSELESGVTTVDEVPVIDVIQTRSGNFWSLNNRRLWCFRSASNIDQIPVRIVKQRPSWFDSRMRKLKNSFHVHIRHSPKLNENDSDSDSDFEYEFDSDGFIALTLEKYLRLFTDSD